MARKNKSNKQPRRVSVVEMGQRELISCSQARARILLTKKKARIVSFFPFKIQVKPKRRAA